jgi:hypothetical protein
MSTQTEEKKVPTKAEVIAFYKEQIEVAKLRRDLAEIVCHTAEFDFRRVEAIAKQAHLTAPAPQRPQQEGMPEGVVPHTVTQEDLDANPELAEQGIKVGDVVGISERPQPEEQMMSEIDPGVDEETPVRKLKKD